MGYKELLKQARENLPEAVFEKERFEIPKVMGHIQGNRTIVTNFYQIANHLHRDPEHMYRFILKELATPGELKKNCIILGTKIPASRINDKIEKYVEEFVLCKECAKPDTKLIKEGGFTFKKCMACGAKSYIKAHI